jgi:hypothetical protein
MSIRTLSPESFAVWTADRGIGRDPQTPQSDRLGFANRRGATKFWRYPDDASRVPHFVGSLLATVRSNDRYWVYPNRGVWSLGREADAWPQTPVWRNTVRAIGVPAGQRGAVWFNSTDADALRAMLFVQVSLGPSVHIDTTVIPDDGNAVLFFEHHQVVWVTLRDQAALDAVVAKMEEAGYPLPTESTEGTFEPLAGMAHASDKKDDETWR